MRTDSRNIVDHINKWAPRQIAHGMKHLQGSPPLRGYYTSDGRIGYSVMRVAPRRGDFRQVLVGSWATVPGTKNDSIHCVWVVKSTHEPDGNTPWAEMAEPRLVGLGYQLHTTVIAAQHAACKGWATCMGGHAGPTTRNRLTALTGLPFHQSKGDQYAGKIPLDPHRVYVHPAGIAFQMPQYGTPLDWLCDRANDEEYQYA